MFKDLEKADGPVELDVDVCVVGAGPVGISITQALVGAGVRVCLAESGGWTDEPETQALYKGESVGHPIPLDEGRYRVFGGSATRWGGRCARFDPIDFEQRSWVAHSGWPIGHQDMTPWYEEAAVVSNATPWIPDEAALASIGRETPRFRSEGVTPFVWRMASPDLRRSWMTHLRRGYSPNFDWGVAYRDVLARADHCHAFLHANLVSLDAGDGSVAGARFRSLNGKTLLVRARRYVLAASGIENTRILLNLPRPLLERANRFDNLGRYFQQHPRGCIARLPLKGPRALALQRRFNVFARGRSVPVHYELGFALSEAVQRRDGLLNASAFFRYSPGEDSSWMAARRLRDGLKAGRFGELPRDAAKAASGGPETAANALRKYLLGTELYMSEPCIRLIIDLEQEPRRDSRVTLMDEVDALGVPRTRVDWRLGDLERRTSAVFARLLAAELDALGFGPVAPEPWIDREGPLTEDELAGNYHFIGATRMAARPEDGVVDPDCRVFGLDNLYLGGASVFTTGGHANPTLTMVALGLRLARHLERGLA